MLQSRNLDDQTFDEIMEYVLGRLPFLCPAWTDYNAHDPGITILELIAWYKEMQQYHMNVVTDGLKQKFLKLLGVIPSPARPAECLIQLPRDSKEEYPALTRLQTPQDISFELMEPAIYSPVLEALYLVNSHGATEVTELLAQPGISIWPFIQNGEGTDLLIGLSGSTNTLRLWFGVDDQYEIPRNPFGEGTQIPRTLEWFAEGSNQEISIKDETHAFSHSGFITITINGEFPLTDGGHDLPKRQYLRIRQSDGGCEEQVRLCDVRAGLFRAVQQETWAKQNWFLILPGDTQITLEDAVSKEGCIYAFVREDKGLRFVESEQYSTENGRLICLHSETCAVDGKPNLLVVTQDQLRYSQLLLASSGLPDMSVDLALGGREAIVDSMSLICDTLCTDGQIRPDVWKYVADLSACGPRDRAFSYDAMREQLNFGDGKHGAIPPRGERRILVASLALSYCGGGNVPADCGLCLEDGTCVKNTAASGGTDAQSLNDAASSFIRSLEHTNKCVSEADYERAAKATPGLRVAAAKAIAGFDPDEPTGRSRIPVVTVVVLPFSHVGRPLPDRRFLDAVQTHLDRLRPICTKIKVIAPSYVPISAAIQVRCRGSEVRTKIQEAVEAYLSIGNKGRSIGDPVVKDDLMDALMDIDGVMRVDRIELRPLSTICYVDSGGDLQLRRDTVAYLRDLDIQIR